MEVFMNTLESTISNKSGIPKGSSKVLPLAIDGLFIALTCVATFFIQVKLPIPGNGGLVHLGNVPLFIAAILFGKRTGALAGGIGMGLFDLLSGWALWAPFTFVIVGFMGFTIGLITEKHKSFTWNVFAIILACIIKIVGYYIAEGIIYGNWITPATSIPGNIVQISIAAIIVLPILPILRKGLNNDPRA
jgi:uncharacterized membrane protein